MFLYFIYDSKENAVFPWRIICMGNLMPGEVLEDKRLDKGSSRLSHRVHLHCS